MDSSRSRDLLQFWFGHPEQPEFGKPRKVWFQKAPIFDQAIRDRFLSDYHQAAAGELSEWQAAPLSCLALILLLDQVSRNVFRGTPQAFATDDQALAVAKEAIAQHFDQSLLPVQRWFMYLPWEHSENLADQQQSLALWNQLKDDPDSASSIDYAIRHAAVIERFGRFPHRNAILGRASTPAELEFLQQPGASF